MNLRSPILLVAMLAAGLCTSAHAAQPPAKGFTAEELVAKNLEARGGADKLRSIKTMHMVGKMKLGGGLEAKIEAWAFQPGHWRDEFGLQGMTAVEAWDGSQAWAINPFGGRKDPQKTSPDDAKDMIESAVVAGPLLDYKAQGSKVEYLGTEDIDGTEAHKLRVTFKNGDSQVLFLDPDHFLEIRIETHHMIRGQERINHQDLGEYEQVDGIYFPFEIGRSQVETIELNKPVDAGVFSFPTTPAKH